MTTKSSTKATAKTKTAAKPKAAASRFSPKT